MNTKIENLTHEDLVDFLSAATYESNWLDCCVPLETRMKLDITDDDCAEDVWAKALLAGEKIEATDFYAEGDTYGSREATLDNDENATYLLSLDDIKNGLQSALDGTFKGDASEKRYAFRCIGHFLDEDDCNDNPEAEDLMQIIMFGEIIYG